MRELVLEKVAKLAAEQATLKTEAVRNFGSFHGEVIVPERLTDLRDEDLVGLLESFTWMRCVRSSDFGY